MGWFSNTPTTNRVHNSATIFLRCFPACNAGQFALLSFHHSGSLGAPAAGRAPTPLVQAVQSCSHSRSLFVCCSVGLHGLRLVRPLKYQGDLPKGRTTCLDSGESVLVIIGIPSPGDPTIHTGRDCVHKPIKSARENWPDGQIWKCSHARFRAVREVTPGSADQIPALHP